MKFISSPALQKAFVLFALSGMVLFGCKRSSTGIPVDLKRAESQIIPYDSISNYINTFQKEKRNLLTEASINKNIDSIFSIAESFDRNTIIALLNAPGAEKLRIYFGYKQSSHQVVFCLLPTDSNGNDIKAHLLDKDNRTAISIPGISSANAQAGGAQGGENGQHCPNTCGR